MPRLKVGLVGHRSYWEGNNYCQQTSPLLPMADVQFSDAKHSQDYTKSSDISSFISLLSPFTRTPPTTLSPKADLSSRC